MMMASRVRSTGASGHRRVMMPRILSLAGSTSSTSVETPRAAARLTSRLSRPVPRPSPLPVVGDHEADVALELPVYAGVRCHRVPDHGAATVGDEQDVRSAARAAQGAQQARAGRCHAGEEAEVPGLRRQAADEFTEAVGVIELGVRTRARVMRAPPARASSVPTGVRFIDPGVMAPA